MIASIYFGFGFLELRIGREAGDDGPPVDGDGIPKRSGVQLSNISRVISGPFGFDLRV